MDKEGFTVTKSKRGIFDILEASSRDFSNGYLYREEVDRRSLEEKPEPFIFSTKVGKNSIGSAPGRKMYLLEGNAAACIAIPLHMFKSPLQIESFPIVCPSAVKDVANKYAPGKYLIKFPNDIACQEHGKKSGGVICRKEGKYCLNVFIFNIARYPGDELLRKEGLKACCMKCHKEGELPTPNDFHYEVAMRMLELFDTLKTPEDVINYTNVELNQFPGKSFKMQVNNPNADIYKDGFCWTRQTQNSLFKGYINGEEYEFQPYLFDYGYFEHYKGQDFEKEMDKNTRELKEQREKEKKEAEEKKKAEEKKE